MRAVAAVCGSRNTGPWVRGVRSCWMMGRQCGYWVGVRVFCRRLLRVASEWNAVCVWVFLWECF